MKLTQGHTGSGVTELKYKPSSITTTGSRV